MQVRPARASDLDALIRIHVAAWQTGYRDLLPAALLDRIDANHARTRLDPVLFLDPPRLLVIGDPARGSIRFGPCKASEAAEVFALLVHPDHWRQGLGRELLDASSSQLQREGFTQVVLWVLETSERARAFYEAQGFAHDGGRRQEGPPSAPLNELRYAKQLT